MTMVRSALRYVGLGLAAGFAVTVWLLPDSDPGDERTVAPVAATPNVRLENRTAAPSAQLPPAPRSDESAEHYVVSLPDEDLPIEPARLLPSVEALVSAGFSRARAVEIRQRAVALGRAAAETEFAATATVHALSGTASIGRAAQGLREALGEVDYERYLDAGGFATRVLVTGVATDSPAQHAGLMPGDEILSYAGQRVFNMRELNALALQGAPGELVAATVVRDDQPMELYVTRGALGLTSP